MSMIWKGLIFIVMCGVIIAAFINPPPQQALGEASRIFYFHVPQAWVSVLAFIFSMVASIRYLAKGKMIDDDRAKVAAQLGLMFCFLAAVTGAVFAKVTWGQFWNWDPRQTSIFVLLLIYGAYFALRSALDTPEKRARLAAVYSIFAFITVPFLMFVVPRVMPSLHPEDSIVTKVDHTVGTVTAGSPAELIGFEPGDKIMMVGDEDVSGIGEMRRLIRKSKDSVAVLSWKRDGVMLTGVIGLPDSASSGEWVGKLRIGKIGLIAKEEIKGSMSKTTAMIFFPSLAVFTALFIWIYIIAVRVFRIERERMEASLL